MKKIIFSVLMGLALLATPTAKAENITADQARGAAAHYLQHNTELGRITADQLTLVRQWNNDELGVPSMYLFAAPEQGWIIMAATTVMDPVVGFADDNVIDADHLAPQLETWLSLYNEMICEVQNADAEKPLADSPEWIKLANRSLTYYAKADVYLLKEKWDQGDEKGLIWNRYSPVVNDSVCPTGCVATAMAQICHFYKYPVRPMGFKTYTWYYTEDDQPLSRRISVRYSDSAAFDYSLMPDKITTPPSSNNLAQRNEVSRIAYYLGTSVNMRFSPSGSGSSGGELTANSMHTYFGYELGTVLQRSAVGATSFLAQIHDDLIQGYPVYMEGASSTGGGRDAAGHAWVCDGYRDNDEKQYHMNWGWGGSGNGWYNLTSNNMPISGMGYNFNRYQTAIVGMTPPADSIVGIRTVEADAALGHAYPNPATISVTLPYNSSSAAELQVYSTDGRLIATRRVAAGSGTVTLRTDSLPAGIYIYRMGTAYGRFVVR